MSVIEEFKLTLQGASKRLGRHLTENMSEVGSYAGERMKHLATIVDEPGFALALVAERDSVAVKAGISTVDGADAADVELRGIILGALAIGARALVIV